MTVEKRAPGEHVNILIFQLPPVERLAFIQKYLPRLSETASTSSKLIVPNDERPSTASWIEHAKPQIAAKLSARADAIGARYDGWSGHGDFNLENLLLDLETNRLTVFDWEYVRRGLPLLFDVFTLLLAGRARSSSSRRAGSPR